MSTQSMLGTVFNDILRVVAPSQEDWEIRFEIINDLQSNVASVETLRGATVEPFGSFVSNLFTRWSDLDISIELLNGSHIASLGKNQKQKLLGDILKALRMRGGWMNLQFINARVPVLKFRSNRQGISCDVSINNLAGLVKSKIFLWINKIDGRFRDMVLLVKQWAKAHKINNSKNGTFNSYSLSLLVIFHFQTCAPAILPPLKDIYPTNMIDDLIGVRADVENLIAETCDANIKKLMSDRSRKINRKSLPDLFIDFLRKFAQMDSWSAELGICPYTGQWEPIKNNMKWLPKTYAIFVEDPFDQPQNSARSVSSGQLHRIAEAFLRTYSVLTSKNQNQSSLLTHLAPPQVSRLIATPVIPNYLANPAIPNFNARPAFPNYGGGGRFHLYPTQPQVQRAVVPRLPRPQTQPQVQRAVVPRLPCPQSQHHSQNVKQGTSSNVSTSRAPMPASQGQKTWRPKIQ